MVNLIPSFSLLALGPMECDGRSSRVERSGNNLESQDQMSLEKREHWFIQIVLLLYVNVIWKYHLHSSR